MDYEIRSGNPLEFRQDENGIRVEGYAAVFDQEAQIGGYFRETIKRGAFVDTIKNDDVVFLINHEGLPIARTKSGTLKLSEDTHGLKISADLEQSDPDVQSIVFKLKRGDLDKMSFAFHPEIQTWDEQSQPPLRTLEKVRLVDVSVVTSPAYDGTEIALRSLAASRSIESAQDFRLRMKRKFIE